MVRASPYLAGLVLGASALGPLAARAEPGDHIRFGEAELTPSLTLLTSWRSNNYLTPGEIAANDAGEAERFRVRSGGFFTVTPAVRFKLNAEYVQHKLDANWEGRKYYAEELSNLDRFRNFGANSKLVILPRGVVGVKLNNSIFASGRETEAVNSEDAYITQVLSANRGSITVRPGSSMELDLGGLVNLTDFNVPPGFGIGSDAASLNTRLGVGAFYDFQWRFLPKTAIVSSLEYEAFDWENNEVRSVAPGTVSADGTLLVPDGRRLLIEAGLRGRFTERVIIGAVLGYTWMDYDATSVGLPDAKDTAGCDTPSNPVTDDLNGLPCALSGNFEVGYDISEVQRLKVGFLRQHLDVFFANYVSMNRYYLGYEGDIGDRLSLVASVDANRQSYRGGTLREDLWFRSRLDSTVHLTGWFDLTAGVWYTGRRDAEGVNSDVEYDDFNVHGGVVFTY